MMTEFDTTALPRYTREEALMLSGLQLAFIGDGIHTLLVRSRVIRTGGRVHDLHKQTTALVNAVSQAKALEIIRPHLTEEELSIVKRGRNAHVHHTLPKAASVGDYAGATGLEALFGFLYITGDYSRLSDLFAMTWPAEPITNR